MHNYRPSWQPFWKKNKNPCVHHHLTLSTFGKIPSLKKSLTFLSIILTPTLRYIWDYGVLFEWVFFRINIFCFVNFVYNETSLHFAMCMYLYICSSIERTLVERKRIPEHFNNVEVPNQLNGWRKKWYFDMKP
jgi:hypothetical protein